MGYSKILITGGNGFLGTKVTEECMKAYPNATVITPSSKEVDLRDRNLALAYFESVKPDAVIAIAARLGGIGDNRKYPASYFYDNMTIGMNTIDGARLSGAKKIVNIGTVCSYPKITPVPFKEEDLWNGYPEPTNGAYGIAKKAVAEYAMAVKKQYGLECVNLLVTNLYGPGDDFREDTSHVIPALIKKILIAKEKGQDEIIAWGDGSPTRDFLYVNDAAKGIIQSLQCAHEEPVNLGSGQEVSIKELFTTIADLLNYKGDVVWDTSKPNGQPKRLLDISRAREWFNFDPQVNFRDGLKQTIDWYLKNRERIDALGPKYGSRR